MRCTVILVSILALAACNESQGSLRRAETGNPDLGAFLLGTVDGCRVWRLRDSGNGGRTVYVSVCGTGAAKSEWTEGCGKACTRQVESLTPAYARDGL